VAPVSTYVFVRSSLPQFSFLLNLPAPLRPDPLVPRLVVPVRTPVSGGLDRKTFLVAVLASDVHSVLFLVAFVLIG
jgi:hypothetical protein